MVAAAVGRLAGTFVVYGGEHVIQPQAVAQARHVARNGAIAKADDDLAALAHLTRELKVIIVADGPFHQRYIDVVGEFLDVGNGAVDEVGEFGQIEKLLVKVQKTHVAPRAATQPDSGQPHLGGAVAGRRGHGLRRRRGMYGFNSIWHLSTPKCSFRGPRESISGNRAASPFRPRRSRAPRARL